MMVKGIVKLTLRVIMLLSQFGFYVDERPSKIPCIHLH
ncbi:hypothetical protein BTN49_1108 [Candidatus Enterovibrio escicola]|uniref:Uncharacterized protein n=1 Tax=Candidatus Enterovibrio escicola TaxID=1927127 RepID=A0A2A5T4M8_9GAMM|nr:hypothetical protein BTN49_1108 [Candidatus Enterovibrio escacola]